MSAGQVKVWNGSAWVLEDILSFRAPTWDATAWDAEHWEGPHPVPAKVWDGSAWYKTFEKPVGAVGPTDWLTVSYTPGAARDDFTGELGVRVLINETRSFTWIGKPNGGGNTGLHRVRVYEWFGDTVVAEGMVDMTGCPLGAMAWVQVPSFTLLAAGYYAILYNATASTGQNWSNQGAITMKPFIGNIYDVYRVPGGAMNASGANLSYVGVDIGWS